MDSYIARQPIFDISQSVVAYELLYRSNSTDNYFIKNIEIENINEKATSDVLINSLINFGVHNLTENAKAFVNFNANLIMENIPEMLDNNIFVIEVLEDVCVNNKLIEKLINLKNLGYIIALDDFVYSYPYIELIELADIIKVDFIENTIEERKKIIDYYKNELKYDCIFLAEKVESYSDFQQAIDLGYTLFQGYFFSKPVVFESKNLLGLRPTYAKLLSEIKTEDPSYYHISKLVERDISLSYKLLKIVNFELAKTLGYRNTIKSIHHGLVFLGIENLSKWFTLILFQDLCEDYPDEFYRLALVRGKIAELISKYIPSLNNRSDECLILGMFSLIDAMLGSEMHLILKELPLEDDIKEALLKNDNLLNSVLELTIAMERGNWTKLERIRSNLGLSQHITYKIYQDSLSWADEIFNFEASTFK